MSTQTETGEVAGTKDKAYDIIWFTEMKGAEQGKQPLAARLGS